MRQKHQKVTPTGKAENSMKAAVIRHSTKHEGKKGEKKKVDLVPVRMRKG